MIHVYSDLLIDGVDNNMFMFLFTGRPGWKRRKGKWAKKRNMLGGEVYLFVICYSQIPLLFFSG